MVFRKRRPEIKPRFVLRAESFPAAGLYPSLKRKLFWRTETSNFRDKPRFMTRRTLLEGDRELRSKGKQTEIIRRSGSETKPRLSRFKMSPTKRGLSRKFDVSVLQKSLRFNEG